uniref:Sushi domain-containing protein n=1 Tax=Terrapene triunguis TaxID=2587831 RepID=A0A674JUL5_9SAUR
DSVNTRQRFPCCSIPCRPPPDITNGSHTGQSEQQFLYGSAVTYKCDQGFSLIGEATIHCTMKNNVDGEWSGPAPECKVVRCPEPEVKNGKKQSGFGPDYSYGNTVIFECDSGYTLNGSSSVKCEANNSWVPSLPTCLRKYKQLHLACSFYKTENGSVNFTQYISSLSSGILSFTIATISSVLPQVLEHNLFILIPFLASSSQMHLKQLTSCPML